VYVVWYVTLSNQIERWRTFSITKWSSVLKQNKFQYPKKKKREQEPHLRGLNYLHANVQLFTLWFLLIPSAAHVKEKIVVFEAEQTGAPIASPSVCIFESICPFPAARPSV
jgi:hypothetical protein